MTVRELIEALGKFDPDLPVIHQDGGQWACEVDTVQVHDRALWANTVDQCDCVGRALELSG